MEGFYNGERENSLHRFRVFCVAIIIECLIVCLFLFVADNNPGESSTLQLIIDDDAADSAVSIVKGMDGFEIKVKSGDLVGKITLEVAGVMDKGVFNLCNIS